MFAVTDPGFPGDAPTPDAAMFREICPSKQKIWDSGSTTGSGCQFVFNWYRMPNYLPCILVPRTQVTL